LNVQGAPEEETTRGDLNKEDIVLDERGRENSLG